MSVKKTVKRRNSTTRVPKTKKLKVPIRKNECCLSDDNEAIGTSVKLYRTNNDTLNDKVKEALDIVRSKQPRRKKLKSRKRVKNNNLKKSQSEDKGLVSVTLEKRNSG